MTLPPAGFRAAFRESAAYFLLPSVRDLIFILVFWAVLAGSFSNRPLADLDIGWHIRTGEQILATHTLPRTDPYSSTMQGQRWFAWEWLYDLVLGILYRACGLNGVVWLCALLAATTFTILLSQLLKRGTGLPLAVALMLLAVAAATIHLFARPHLVSWLFVLLWFVALEKWERGGKGSVQGSAEESAKESGKKSGKKSPPRWLPWFFPVSTLLWVNLHGAWVFGFVLLAIYALAALVEGMREQDAFVAIRAAHRARAMAWAWIFSARRDPCESVWLAAAFAHLSLPRRSIPHEPDCRIPLA